MYIAPRLRAEREASEPKPPTPTGETLLKLDRPGRSRSSDRTIPLKNRLLTGYRPFEEL